MNRGPPDPSQGVFDKGNNLPGFGSEQSNTPSGSDDSASSFYIYPNTVFGNSEKYFWKPVAEINAKSACFVDVLESHRNRVRDPQEASLFVVPLYRIEHIVDAGNASHLAAVIANLRDNLPNTRQYIDFGGASHVFVYLKSVSKGFMKQMMDQLYVDLYSFWAAPEPVEYWDNWRCPHRHLQISLETETGCKTIKDPSTREPSGQSAELQRALAGESSRHHQGVDAMVDDLAQRSRGRGIWECRGTSSTLTDTAAILAGTGRGKFVSYTFIDEGHQTLTCFMPKCASTVMKMMQKRQTGLDTWKDTAKGTRWQGLVHFPHDAAVGELRAVVDNPGWVKVAVVRDPVIRCLSGYLQKIVQLKNYGFIRWKAKRDATFEEFVDVLYSYPSIRRGNDHFLEQSAMCGHRAIHYNYIAHVETLHQDYKSLLQRLGLWESFGAWGWGADGHQAFLEAFEPSYNHPNQLESSAGDASVAAHYTMGMLEKVYEMYREDFERFGYSIDKWRRLVAQKNL
ncbi:unnamed protein product [Ostreobium quekettii]|uniref:Uncharacterized protein n=1 Tax=Ostreobium quekettii TaxID=121088 RepID=A0A8S1J2S9_9CHLO|nr:unnamed protein product [Ostreobium quekettii]